MHSATPRIHYKKQPDMLKRLLVLPLLFLYLLSTAGVRMQAHYCHGAFSSFTFNPFHDFECGCAEESETMSCCDEAQVILKVQEIHAPSSSVSVPATVLFYTESPFERSSFSIKEHTRNAFPLGLVPDRPPAETIISLGQFRI